MPLRRFVFLDCDGLREAVLSHMQERPSEFVIDRSSVAFPLDPLKLTVLLSGTDSVAKPHRGVCFDLSAEDAAAFASIGWNLRKKSALEHNTLQKLVNGNLTTSGYWASSADRKTLVLAIGDLTPAIVNCLEAYLLGKWFVRLYCFRTAVSVEICDRLRASNPVGFQSIYLDRFLKDLLIGDHSYVAMTDAVGELNGVQALNGNGVALQNPQAGGRFVFMDMDNVFQTLSRSESLYLKVPGATSSRNLRINLSALTDRTCADQSMVQRQIATYCIAAALAGPLTSLRWETMKQLEPDTGTPILELLAKLISSAAAAAEKTLVLVMGDGNLDDRGKASFTGLLSVLIAQQWHVEVHAWVDSLGGVFAELQAAHPASVVIKPLDEALAELVYVKPTEVEPSAGSAVSSNLAAGSSSLGMSLLVQQMKEMQQQMKEMQAAFAGLQASVLAPSQLQQEKDELDQLLYQQEEELFDLHAARVVGEAERQRQATEAHLKHRLMLQKRESMLTCPITQCLYETPVVTSCCGKTFSQSPLDGLQGSNRTCPLCRQEGFTTHLNRDMVQLVELFKAECDALESAPC
ncbi:hypothetical protein BBJ28_00018035 [Nothophytophthora sp. Chile5]|nr:hypothetical protein BBJ28_00018035 [Nothophytophthora sp. Chile5]